MAWDSIGRGNSLGQSGTQTVIKANENGNSVHRLTYG